MKKSSFVALALGAVSSICFALGMCMVLLPAWDAFLPGIVLGCMGLALGLTTLLIWRKMEHKAPICLSRKTILTVTLGVAGALALGVGMCFCMVWQQMAWGIGIGLIGILALLGLIPLIKGFQ